ncbi:MAG: efflux RND transporter periplasmic adaptor subunit [Acidobacteria bacterium]|nr:efflux RND transporter periplasmic adaptor subunit [Acidobacteriota bacterium]
MRGQHKKILFRTILAFGVIVVLGGFSLFLLRPAQVTVTAVRIREIRPSIQGIGTVESKNVVMVASKVAGRIIAINADQGDSVSSGQVLAALEDTEAQAEIERAEASLQRSRSSVEVQRSAIQRSSSGVEIQRTVLQKTKANAEVLITGLRKAKSAVAVAETAISKARVVQQQAQTNAARWRRLYDSGDTSKMDTEERLTQAKAADEDLNNAVAQRNTALEEVRNVESQIKAAAEEIRQAEAQLKAANDDYEIQKKSLQVIEQDISTAEAALDSATARKADNTIISQTTGFIVSRELEPGAVVNPGTPILKLADPTTIWATVYVDELYARSFEVGDSAEITLRSMQTNSLSGKVARIRRESDRVTEQLAVDISFDKAPENLRLGEQIEAVIKPKSRTAKAIPASALLPSKEGFGVWAVNDGRLKFTKLQIGLVDSSGWTEVVSGLEEGEKVVVSPGKLTDSSNEGRSVSTIEDKTAEPPK